MNGSYTIRASGIFQLDQEGFRRRRRHPGDREFRGSIEIDGPVQVDRQVGLRLGRNSDHRQVLLPGLRALPRNRQAPICCASTPDYVALAGLSRRAAAIAATSICARMYFWLHQPRRSEADSDHPSGASTHDYTFKQPVFGGEVSVRSNMTSLSRGTAAFDPITQMAATTTCARSTSADPARKTPQQLPAARLSRHLHALLERSELATHGDRSVRPDVHAVRVAARRLRQHRRSKPSRASPTTSTPGDARGRARHADRRSRVPLSRSSMCNPGARRPSSRSRR